jgi:small neutral amino acid transporter SnatA (MarC family)
MQEAAKNLLLVLVALFPIVDPLGGSPFFLALTREYAPEARKHCPGALPSTVFSCWLDRILLGLTFWLSLGFRCQWCRSAEA